MAGQSFVLAGFWGALWSINGFIELVLSRDEGVGFSQVFFVIGFRFILRGEAGFVLVIFRRGGWESLVVIIFSSWGLAQFLGKRMCWGIRVFIVSFKFIYVFGCRVVGEIFGTEEVFIYLFFYYVIDEVIEVQSNEGICFGINFFFKRGRIEI